MIDISSLLPETFAFAASFAFCVFIVLTKQHHSTFSSDHTEGVQKFHSAPTPRIGGVGLAVGYFVLWLTQTGETKALLGLIALAGSPVLLFGLAEDISKNVSVTTRMLATLTAGILFGVTAGYTIELVYVQWIDNLLAKPGVSLAFTAFAIGSAANATNIIDGFHGLASGTILIVLASIVLVSWRVGDTVLFEVALSFAAITGGFFLVNFPFGKIFLGDGGAYFLGFLVAALCIMLPARNPEVSPWICPLILSYPLTELIVSISRKIRRKGHHPGRPDNLHLHMIVYRIVTERSRLRADNEVFTHGLTSLFLWMFPLVSLLLVSISDLTGNFAVKMTFASFCLYLIAYSIAHMLDEKSAQRSNSHGDTSNEI